MAQDYLDSCKTVFARYQEGGLRLPFIEMNQCFIDIRQGSHSQAIAKMQSLIPWFEKQLPSFLVLVYAYLGDAYGAMNNQRKALELYKKSIKISDQYHSHIDFSILVYERLIEVYEQLNDPTNALAAAENVLLLE